MKYTFACVVGDIRIKLLTHAMLPSPTTQHEAEALAVELSQSSEWPIAIIAHNGKFAYEVGIYARGHTTVS
jgi:hypothetical protein